MHERYNSSSYIYNKIKDNMQESLINFNENRSKMDELILTLVLFIQTLFR